jgi:hypothetical protein
MKSESLHLFGCGLSLYAFHGPCEGLGDSKGETHALFTSGVFILSLCTRRSNSECMIIKVIPWLGV